MGHILLNSFNWRLFSLLSIDPFCVFLPAPVRFAFFSSRASADITALGLPIAAKATIMSHKISFTVVSVTLCFSLSIS